MLSGAYAADAVEDEVERRRFERHLAECEPCREEVRTLRETAARLADAASVTPPARLRAQVLADIARTAQLPPTAERPGTSIPARDLTDRGGAASRPGRRLARIGAIAASVVALAGIGLGAAGGLQLYRARQAEEQARVVLAIAADPAARRVSGAVAGGGTATVVVAGSRAALLTTGVPALTGDRTYQLWLVRPNQIVSAGLGPAGPDAAGQWSRLIEGVRPGDSVAISVEPEGGSQQPTTTPITVLAT